MDSHGNKYFNIGIGRGIDLKYVHLKKLVMIYSVKIFTSVFVSCLLLLFQSVYGQVKLPRLVRDSMILQRDTKSKYLGLGCER